MWLLVLLLAAPTVETRTTRDDDADVYYTNGQVRLDVPFSRLARVAGDFHLYRRWSLKGINGNGEREFITQLRDVRWRPGGPKGLGIFALRFDVDLVWPFGSTDNIVEFAVQEAVAADGGGIRELLVMLHGDNTVINEFQVRLVADGDASGSRVRFRSRVRFADFFDAFLTMARYRRNIEWRIVKVIQNLKRYVETPPSK